MSVFIFCPFGRCKRRTCNRSPRRNTFGAYGSIRYLHLMPLLWRQLVRGDLARTPGWRTDCRFGRQPSRLMTDGDLGGMAHRGFNGYPQTRRASTGSFFQADLCRVYASIWATAFLSTPLRSYVEAPRRYPRLLSAKVRHRESPLPVMVGRSPRLARLPGSVVA
jgi:hypothetical protein